MPSDPHRPHIYDGEGDRLMAEVDQLDRIILVPDALPSKAPDRGEKLRIQWGQHLLEDLLADRYRSLVCAVNAVDNSGGIISQLAELLPTSQWNARSITEYIKKFSAPDGVKVIRFDMDVIEVLALLRPSDRETLSLDDLAQGFMIVVEMLRRNTQRLPSASVSFIGARSNALRDADGKEPSLESVLRVMHEAGYTGDVYPAPAMWSAAPTGVYARYPFPPSVESMRHGGF
ncbi:MAG: hypothetical protein GC164_05680 [Phycisphaera sp.]|nr:hypothetical protein [Phycisphaera sp.]